MTGKEQRGRIIDELLDLADVARDNDDARWWMDSALPRLPVEPRSERAEWNKPFDRLKTRAEALLYELRALRNAPYQHAAFWSNVPEPFGRVDAGGKIDRKLPIDVPTGTERGGLIDAVRQVVDAAEQSRRGAGQSAKPRKQELVNRAAAFWVRFSPHPISETGTGRFFDFAQAFYIAAAWWAEKPSKSQRKKDGIERQVANAVRFAKQQHRHKPPVVS